jgi:hypothetical protein
LTELEQSSTYCNSDQSRYGSQVFKEEADMSEGIANSGVVGSANGSSLVVGDGAEDPEASVARVDLELDEEAAKQLAEGISGLMEHVLSLQSQAADRLAELDEDERQARTRPITLALHRSPRS